LVPPEPLTQLRAFALAEVPSRFILLGIIFPTPSASENAGRLTEEVDLFTEATKK
jgi:hypothetical protein